MGLRKRQAVAGTNATARDPAGNETIFVPKNDHGKWDDGYKKMDGRTKARGTFVGAKETRKTAVSEAGADDDGTGSDRSRRSGSVRGWGLASLLPWNWWDDSGPASLSDEDGNVVNASGRVHPNLMAGLEHYGNSSGADRSSESRVSTMDSNLPRTRTMSRFLPSGIRRYWDRIVRSDLGTSFPQTTVTRKITSSAGNSTGFRSVLSKGQSLCLQLLSLVTRPCTASITCVSDAPWTQRPNTQQTTTAPGQTVRTRFGDSVSPVYQTSGNTRHSASTTNNTAAGWSTNWLPFTRKMLSGRKGRAPTSTSGRDEVKPWDCDRSSCDIASQFPGLRIPTRDELDKLILRNAG